MVENEFKEQLANELSKLKECEHKVNVCKASIVHIVLKKVKELYEGKTLKDSTGIICHIKRVCSVEYVTDKIYKINVDNDVYYEDESLYNMYFRRDNFGSDAYTIDNDCNFIGTHRFVIDEPLCEDVIVNDNDYLKDMDGNYIQKYSKVVFIQDGAILSGYVKDLNKETKNFKVEYIGSKEIKEFKGNKLKIVK